MKNIAIVGSGISGLVVAYQLRDHCRVTLLEANGYLGGHTNTVQVEDQIGAKHCIDTGFIVFNRRTYPRFCQLLSELGVESKPTTMSFSFADPAIDLEYQGHSLNTMFAQRRNLLRPSFFRMIRDILRFNREAGQVVETEDNGTVQEFLDRSQYSTEFRKHYLLPMAAAIWSCPVGTIAQFPIRFLIRFYQNHGLLQLRDRPQWRVVEGGSHTYVKEICSRWNASVQLGTPVAGVERKTDRVYVRTADGGQQSFDEIVFACHADQALRILGSEATPDEKQILGQFPYTGSVATLHTDESLLPKRDRARASWNYRQSADPGQPFIVTYDMNRLQGIRSCDRFCVTLNGEALIDPRQVVRQFHYEHPVFTVEREAAQSRHRELLGANRTYYCGAYWRNGFHEDGVVSAEAVVQSMLDRDSGQDPVGFDANDLPTEVVA